MKVSFATSDAKEKERERLIYKIVDLLIGIFFELFVYNHNLKFKESRFKIVGNCIDILKNAYNRCRNIC